jgi:5'-nucleotidase
MKKAYIHFILISCLFTASCGSLRKGPSEALDDKKIDLTFLLVNDVYEIAPLEGGKVGGMARVATLKKESLRSNPNTFLIIAGDFLSPSVYNSLQYEGKRIRGKQMIESMNAAGMDFAIFGNHEFDINENELQERLNESQFKWISSNTFHKQGTEVKPFTKTTSSVSQPIPKTYIQTVTDADGTTAKVGFIGLTLPFNKATYVSYTEPLPAAEEFYNRLKDSCDVVVAITHQEMEEDVILAKKLPGLALILGGHEHDMRFQKVGNVYIVKAHANAKSAYIVNLNIDKKEIAVKINPQLKLINESLAIDSATDVVVQKWMDIGNRNYSSLGFVPTSIVIKSGESLDGRETSIRTKATNLTKIIVSAMEAASPGADVAIINAGSIRVDDILPTPITQYDIIRSLPFGGGILEVDMKGSLLTRVLNAGRNNSGNGGFLHFSPSLTYDASAAAWLLKGVSIDAEKVYKVALTDFLMTGGEANMEFLTKENPEIIRIDSYSKDVLDARNDVRLTIVKYLENKKY